MARPWRVGPPNRFHKLTPLVVTVPGLPGMVRVKMLSVFKMMSPGWGKASMAVLFTSAKLPKQYTNQPCRAAP